MENALESGIYLLAFGLVLLIGAIKGWEFIVNPSEELCWLYSQAAIKKFFGKVFLLKETYFIGSGFTLLGIYFILKSFGVPLFINFLHAWFVIFGIGVVSSLYLKYRIISFLRENWRSTWEELGEPHSLLENSDEKRADFYYFLWSGSYLKLENKNLNFLAVSFFIAYQVSVFSVMCMAGLFLLEASNLGSTSF